MAIATPPSCSAEAAYDASADFYDAFAGHPDYGRWIASLLDLARRHGARAETLLDVGCGTGASFLPLLERGIAVVGCDISAGMLARARAKAPGVEMHRFDMRALPRLGAFDVVWCVNDALNYLRDPADVTRALTAMAANLAPGGVLLFDVNTRLAFETVFSSERVVDAGEAFVAWTGLGCEQTPAGTFATALLHGFEEAGGLWRRSTARHEQRLHTDPEVRRAVAGAGLELLDAVGVHAEGAMQSPPDPARHIKTVYVARCAERR
jgi:SAM-dependent methyltransferase